MDAKGLRVSDRIHLQLDAYLMRRVRKVIALSEPAKQRFVSLGKVKSENVCVLPIGVDTDFFRPETQTEESIRKRYGWQGKLSVLFVGRLASIKGVEYLMRAADIVINQFGHREVLFVLVGPHTFAGVDKPVDMKKMLDYIGQHEMHDNVILVGSVPRDDTRGLYAACDIFVLPSLAEGDPAVVVEAMASGKPVIGTRVGGTVHKIRDGWNGFLIDPANERQLADRIEYLVLNPEERKRMGANARRFVEDEFDWRILSEKLLHMYESIY
jgi:glycosyltransferase involved in cell wall biosynthesis